MSFEYWDTSHVFSLLQVVDDYKRNEACLKESIAELREANRIKEKTLESVQIHAANQLDTVQRDNDRIQREHEQELTRLRAMLRKTELKVISLQESLDQKVSLSIIGFIMSSYFIFFFR